MTETEARPSYLAGGKPATGGDFILQRRYRLVLEALPPTGKVLLDFGCGNGAQTLYFAPHFPVVVGVDVGRSYLERFRDDNLPTGSSTGILYDGHRLPVADASVDYAISFEVLEHVASEHDALTELARVIRPGGRLALSVPNRWWIFETHGAALPLLPWNRVPFFSWLPKPLHDRYARARIYRRREIVALVQRYGFTVRSSCYVTAPMDVIRWRSLQALLRKTVFRPDKTPVPMLSTAVLVLAERAHTPTPA